MKIKDNNFGHFVYDVTQGTVYAVLVVHRSVHLLCSNLLKSTYLNLKVLNF